ncbi:hypothetical protein [Mammaliicoccus stepanovicii]|uniref:Lipoprotein n=1 Tax=Mammaliicoccus stepanovicii TaxID=643214 RepID=A0A239Y7I9_9STAP|nr:hypothetical protein [Mammaliicoccus stepanovicii]PNZ77211.1 hypothetical protein CD111_04685 [Mammaliicoccus stepanovicii]GGI43217.1 hypothetical protein GCM10010896_22330 [Mammaliicoccus stepanovicii]SNV54827.1 lipoprotein [Mammaliicoccus stepanovicii]
MKKILYIGVVLVSSVTIAGCSFSIGNGSSDKETNKSEQKSEHKTKESSSNSNTKNKDTHASSKSEVPNISEKETIAMTLMESNLESKVVTADELLKGSFTMTSGAGEKITKSFDKLTLSESPELNKMDNKPEGMNFYGVEPSKGPYATIVGINKEKIVYIMTQSAIFDYKEVEGSNTFIEYNISDLYNKHKGDSKIRKLEEKIEYGESMAAKQSKQDSNVDTTSNEYYAKVLLTAIPTYRESDTSDKMKPELENESLEGEYLNPYNKQHTIKYPEGVQRIAGTPTAAGQVVYKNNDDGTISVYGVPSHFHDNKWLEDDDWSQKESERIMNNPKVLKLYDATDAEIARTVKMFDGTYSSEENDQSSEKVTRENVIDKVESYEGHKLDTDTYKYKEPEQNDKGEWGFSFEDKDGNLAGSYIIDEDGYVTEYDEKGKKVGSGS